MVHICDFSVGYDNEIEFVEMYDEDIYNKEQMTDFINGLVRDRKLIIGERCEGGISLSDNNTLKIDFKYCTKVGEDWNDDEWGNSSIETPLP